MVKAILLGLGWTYHHDKINNQVHEIIRQSGMASQIEVDDYFIRELHGMAVTPNDIVPILCKHLRGCVPDRRQLGIVINKFPGGIEQFTEVKVIHNGTVHYMRPDVRNEQQGSSAVDKFQSEVRKSYLVNLKRKDSVHFGTSEGERGPLETIFS